ncbi:MAG: glycosyltransferase [Methyloligellaceae bacterium]
MNIHYVYQRFPELSQTFVHDQMRYLKNNGHHISLSCKKIQDKDHKLISPDFYDELLLLSSSNLLQMPSKLLSMSKSKRKLSDYAEQLTLNFSGQKVPDILVAHFGPNVLLGSHVKKEIQEKLNLNIPLVGVFHGYDLSKYLQKHGKQVYHQYEACIDLFITISDYWKKLLLNIGIEEKRIKTIRLGVKEIDNEIPQPKNKRLTRILSIGRMVEKKGFDDLITAFSLIKQKDDNAILEIVGDGPELSRHIALAMSLKLKDSIVFSGALSHSEVMNKMCRTDLFVLASKTADNGDMEGIPVVLMEAMACGIPVISTSHSGIPELIENEVTGLLVTENSPTELAQAISKLVNNQNFAYNLACNAKVTIRKRYNQSTQNALFEKELSALVPH